MADFGGDIMAEAEAQRVQMKPVYTLPLLPLTNTTQHRDYRGKVHTHTRTHKHTQAHTHTQHCIMLKPGKLHVFFFLPSQ